MRTALRALGVAGLVAAVAAVALLARAGNPKPTQGTKVACTMVVYWPGRDEVRGRSQLLVDRAGRLVEEQNLTDAGAVYSRFPYRRDALGRVVEKCVVLVRDGKEIPFRCSRPRYHAASKLAFETEEMEANGERVGLSRHQYDSQGRETVRVTVQGSSEITSTFIYAADGRLEEIRNKATRWSGSVVNKRSAAGDVIETVVEIEGGKPTVTRYPTPCPESVLVDLRIPITG